ncbi:MAG: class I SAM-dependent methyltransferase [bacterium]|nr:class I SAM-dependent methyltransferase [bacterium]
MFQWKKDVPAVAPYSRLASIYDYVMRHVDYVHWASYVESLLARHDLAPESLIDLACGTGSLALELARRGYQMSGSDGCAEMLVVGKEKVKRQGYEIPFYHRNLLDLSSLSTFEGVLCLYDSMNYLMTLSNMATALQQVRRVVSPGGVFIFDVCTESNSMRYFRDMTDKDQGDGFSYTRHSYYDNGVQFNKFEIRFEDPQEVVREVHSQRIYSLSDIEAVLEDAPFQVEGVYGGYGFEPPTELADRVHFVLRG